MRTLDDRACPEIRPSGPRAALAAIAALTIGATAVLPTTAVDAQAARTAPRAPAAASASQRPDHSVVNPARHSARRTIVVSPRGSDRASGTLQRPLRTLGAAIRRARSGDIIALRRGTYQPSVTVPSGKRLTIRSHRNETVWFDGSTRVKDWEPSGGDWVRHWTKEFNSSPTFVWNAPDGPAPYWQFINPQYSMAAHPDQVWINGKRQRQVSSRSQVRRGTFYVNDDANRLYIGSSPRGRTVRASTKAKAMAIRASGTKLRGIGVRRYAPSVPHLGAVSVEARDVGIERSRFVDNATIGLSILRHRTSLYRVSSRRNGMMGIHVHLADGLRLKRVSVVRNNVEHFNRTPAAAGLKITSTRHIRIRSSQFTHNDGTGLWIDESGYKILLNNVTSRDNRGHGASLEVSTRALVLDSLFMRNRGFGLKVNNISAVEIWNSTLHANDRSINVVQDDRRHDDRSDPGHNPSRPFPDPTMEWVNRPVSIRNSIVSSTRGNCLVCVEDYSHRYTAEQLRITLQGNVYQRPSARAPYWFAVWSRGSRHHDPSVFTSLSAFRAATGRDGKGKLFEGRPVLGRGGSALAHVRSLEGTVAVPIPSRIAELVGRRAGVKHLGAWIDG